jgi:hypothetical protein
MYYKRSLLISDLLCFVSLAVDAYTHHEDWRERGDAQEPVPQIPRLERTLVVESKLDHLFLLE